MVLNTSWEDNLSQDSPGFFFSKKIPNVDFINIQLIYFLIIPTCALGEASWKLAFWKFLALYSESCMEKLSTPGNLNVLKANVLKGQDKEEIRLKNPTWRVNSLFLCSHWANKVLCKPGNALFTQSCFEIIIDFCPCWCLGGDYFLYCVALYFYAV